MILDNGEAMGELLIKVTLKALDETSRKSPFRNNDENRVKNVHVQPEYTSAFVRKGVIWFIQRFVIKHSAESSVSRFMPAFDLAEHERGTN